MDIATGGLEHDLSLTTTFRQHWPLLDHANTDSSGLWFILLTLMVSDYVYPQSAYCRLLSPIIAVQTPMIWRCHWPLPTFELTIPGRCADGHAATIFRDHVRNDDIRERLKVENITERCRKARLSRFGHVKRRDQEYVGRKTLDMVPPGRRKRGRPKQRWMRYWGVWLSVALSQ